MKQHLNLIAHFHLLATAGLCLLSGSLLNAQTRASLAAGFLHPQDSTRTKVWWFHGQTQTTRAGITADLEAFKQAGVGGVVYYDQVHGRPDADALEGMSAPWWQMFTYAAEEAERLGLTFEANISNGYVTGGRWITPALSMQRLAWTERVVKGGAMLKIPIPVEHPKLNYYGDVAVLAVPYEASLFEQQSFDSIPILRWGQRADVVLDCGRSMAARSLSYTMAARGKSKSSAMALPCAPTHHYVGYGYAELPPMGELQVSSDGKTYQTVCSLQPIYRDLDGSRDLTLSFPAVEGRYFRLHLHDWWLDDRDTAPLKITRATLSARARVDCFEHKNGSYSDFLDSDQTPEYTPAEILHSADILDLTSLLHGDTLDWNAPRGEWLVMRFYHEPTGKNSKHGRPNLLGLECDKMNADAALYHWQHYPQLLIDTLRTHGAAIQGITMDSHEQGAQNWTHGFDTYFLRRNGYDLRPWLPVMAGFVVDSKERSDALLRDVRHTIGDKIAADYYGTFNRLCRRQGLTLTAQAIGGAQAMVADQIAVKRFVDKPQGEFWNHHPDGTYDIKECSSAAHLYGRPIASGEAFTDAKYSQPLSYIKQLADAAYGLGLNEFVICASAAQPWLDRTPGNTANGRQYCFNRNNTYWPVSAPFWDYQARCAFLLRQGLPVHDLLLYLGDEMPLKMLPGTLPVLPQGYSYDACSSDALFHRLCVKDSHLVLPDGQTYQALLVKSDALLTPAVRVRIDSLRRAGVPVWTDDGSLPFAAFAERYHLAPDLQAPQDRSATFAHRSLPDADVYFLANHDSLPLTCTTYALRAIGRSVQLWDAVTGRRYRLSADRDGAYSRVKLSLAAYASAFVVVSDEPEEPELPLYEADDAPAIELRLAKNWNLRFKDKNGLISRFATDTLTDWTLSADPRIRYFSGTADYATTFRLRPRSGRRYWLHFDTLHDVARVSLNGQDVGIVWCSPREIDITDHLRRGRNQLRIEVTNSLYNRMIGDTQLPESQRTTWATTDIVTSDTPLTPSGIQGVSIRSSLQR